MIRFTIRDVLWLTVVVALAIAWWIDRRSLRSALTATQVQLAEVEADRAAWEERTQLGAATHLKMLRVITTKA